MPSPAKSSRVIAYSADAKIIADYQSKGFVLGLWSPKWQGYEILRAPRTSGRRAKIPLVEHDKIRVQCELYRKLRDQARALSPKALAKRHGVTAAVIERIDAGVPYTNLATEDVVSAPDEAPSL